MYWIEDQLADVSTWFYTLTSWTVGDLTGYQIKPSQSRGQTL